MEVLPEHRVYAHTHGKDDGLYRRYKGPPRPIGVRFAVPHTGAGLDDFVGRLNALKPNFIVLEVTVSMIEVSAAGARVGNNRYERG